MEEQNKQIEQNANIGIDEDTLISELRQAYQSIQATKETAEYEKVKRATESAILLRRSQENEEK